MTLPSPDDHLRRIQAQIPALIRERTKPIEPPPELDLPLLHAKRPVGRIGDEERAVSVRREEILADHLILCAAEYLFCAMGLIPPVAGPRGGKGGALA